jgi:hypothetical protein
MKEIVFSPGASLARVVVVLAAVLVGIAVIPACQVQVNCPDVAAQPWWGSVDSDGITYAGYGGATISGTVWRPDDTTAYPGPRPVVVVAAGYAESECNQWWSAWALAGHGYVVLSFSEPQPSLQVPDLEAGIDWLASSANPWLSVTDMSRLGVVGHSAGASYGQIVEAADTRVKAMVALDNLRHMSWGCPDDPSSPADAGAPVLNPRAPALGLSRDSDCDLTLETGDHDLMTPGFEFHDAAGVPTAMFSLAGAQHFDFETSGPDSVHQHAFYAMQAWLDAWVAGDPTAMDRLTATTWNGADRSTILSPYYRSAIDVPTYTCLDLRSTCSPAGASPAVHPSQSALAAAAAPADPTVLTTPHSLAPPGTHYDSDLDYTTGQAAPGS